jgi:hypothetical protein
MPIAEMSPWQSSSGRIEVESESRERNDKWWINLTPTASKTISQKVSLEPGLYSLSFGLSMNSCGSGRKTGNVGVSQVIERPFQTDTRARRLVSLEFSVDERKEYEVYFTSTTSEGNCGPALDTISLVLISLSVVAPHTPTHFEPHVSSTSSTTTVPDDSINDSPILSRKEIAIVASVLSSVFLFVILTFALIWWIRRRNLAKEKEESDLDNPLKRRSSMASTATTGTMKEESDLDNPLKRRSSMASTATAGTMNSLYSLPRAKLYIKENNLIRDVVASRKVRSAMLISPPIEPSPKFYNAVVDYLPQTLYELKSEICARVMNRRTFTTGISRSVIGPREMPVLG